MLFSYANTPEERLPDAAKRFTKATEKVSATLGMLLTREALQAYLSDTHLDREIDALIKAIDDDESQRRVDEEIVRRVVTGKVGGDVAEALREAIEVLGLHKQDFTVADIPLIAVGYADKPLQGPPVIINAAGLKSLADAVRQVWAKLLVSPYEDRDVAVAVMRMPPAEATAEVVLGANAWHVDAVQGWGRLVGTEEAADTFTFNKAGLQINGKDVGIQKSMIARNDRTQQIVKTVPSDGAAQNITDAQARELCVDMRKAGLTRAVFGIAGEKRWLLRVLDDPLQTATQPVQGVEDEASADHAPQEHVEEAATDDRPEPVTTEFAEPHTSEEISEDPEEPTDDRSFSEEPEVEIVDLASDGEPAVDEEPSVPEPREEQDEGYDESEPEDESAAVTFQRAKQLMTAATMQAYKTIELTMREWLWDEDQPEDFAELVELVSTKRQVPYKQRILSLQEMKKQAAFEDPDADTVRFALETMERFVREF